MRGGAEDHDQKDGIKGFAGLSSLVSDVDATVSEVGRKAEVTPQAADPEAARMLASKRSSPSPESSPAHQLPPQSSGGGSAGKWIVGMAVVVGVIWLALLSDKRTSSPSPTYTPASESQAVTTSPPAWQPPSPAVEQPRRPTEEPPPVGYGLSLTMPQLRYCTAENIRLDAAKAVINSYSDTDVDRFNALVADYNSRCGQFRYKRGALESARSEVEQSRSDIETEGRARFPRASAPVGSTVRRPDVPVEKPDVTVQAIQRILNKFGYDAGEEDGFAGEQMRTAISAFQRDQNISVDGKSSLELLKRLTEHVAPAQTPTATNSAASPPAQSPARSTTQDTPATPVSPSNTVAPPVVRSPQRAQSRQEQANVSGTEQAAIERACESARLYSGLSAYQACLARETSGLQSSGGRPDLSRVTEHERNSIERACDSARQYSGPGAYYSCLKRELSSLNTSRGRPDLSSASQSEQAAIERACDSARQYSGPGAYYNCLNRELSSLNASRGSPDMSRFTAFEQSAIERACDSARQYSGPGAYYNCLNREIASLRSSGGAPDFSNLTSIASAAVERACDGARQYSGPGAYYNCLRREVNKAGSR